jgi:predicted phosphodiesterase
MEKLKDPGGDSCCTVCQPTVGGEAEDGRTVEIVGALGDGGCDALLLTCALTRGGLRALSHGADFTGRPGTQLRVCDEFVIKLRTELQPRNAAEARSFVFRALEKERRVGAHHPAKTWFLLFGAADRPPTIGNITPRLRPLHCPEDLSLADAAAFEGLLCRVFTLYLETAARHEVGLDISLSNFAIDRQGGLFYVDDDFYPWDEFNTLCQFLGVLIRSREDLDEGAAGRLGACLREGILRAFGDPIWTTVVAEELRGLFVPPAKQPLVQAMATQVARRPTVAAPPPGVAAVQALSPEASPQVAPREEAPQLLAILGDIHANAPALEAVLAELDRRGVARGLVVGDIVGYGPHPQECIDLLAARPGLRCVKGNHDHAAASGYFALGFSSLARWVIEWSIPRLSASALGFLDGLPLELRGEVAGAVWLAVHGSPTDRRHFNAYVYEMTYEENLENLAGRGIDWCFHGHTHLQKVFFRQRERQEGVSTAPRQPLGEYRHALICPGSVGQPRGGRPGAEFALLDVEQGLLEFQRLDYDLGRVVADMRRFSFPDNLIQRLEDGR